MKEDRFIHPTKYVDDDKCGLCGIEVVRDRAGQFIVPLDGGCLLSAHLSETHNVNLKR